MALIRRVLVYYPDAGVLTVQRLLKKPTPQRPEGLQLDRGYLTRLVDKIRREREKRINKGTLARVSELQDHYKTLALEAATILTSREITSKDKVDLLIRLFRENVRLFEIEQSAGIFEKHLGEMVVRQEITQEQRILIIQAMKNYGIDYPKKIGDGNVRKSNK